MNNYFTSPRLVNCMLYSGVPPTTPNRQGVLVHTCTSRLHCLMLSSCPDQYGVSFLAAHPLLVSVHCIPPPCRRLVSIPSKASCIDLLVGVSEESRWQRTTVTGVSVVCTCSQWSYPYSPLQNEWQTFKKLLVWIADRWSNYFQEFYDVWKLCLVAIAQNSSIVLTIRGNALIYGHENN